MIIIPRGLDRRVWQMAFARAFSAMGLSLAMVFLGIYVVQTRGYPARLYGVISLAANLCQSLANAWAGGLSDRIGRKPLIVGSLFLRAIVLAGLGAEILYRAPLWLLSLNIIASAFLRGGFEPTAYALVADVVRDDQRVTAFGIQRMGTNLGWAIGPAIGGMLALVIPYGAVFYGTAAGLTVAGLVALRVAEPERKPPRAAVRAPGFGGALGRALRDGMANRLMRMLLLGTLLCGLLETQMFSTLSIYAIKNLQVNDAHIGLLYTVNGLGVLVLQVPALAVIRRLGIGVTLPWSSLLDALGFVLIGLASGFPGAVLAMVVLTGAEVLFDPSQQTAIAEVADPAQRGTAYGVVGFASMIGIAFAPLLGGALLDAIGDHPLWMWLAVGAIGGGQTVCFISFVRRRRAAVTPARAPG
jgi:MFS family permease